MIACPKCDATMPTLLGTLGNLTHFRCRDCGWEYNMPADQVVTLEEDADLIDADQD